MAAHMMNLPSHQLHWDEVVKYAFLSEFDLLRDSQQDVSQQPWTMPTAHLMMDWYFKKCHALEEVQCLNIEICHFITYIQDEDHALKATGDSGTMPSITIPMQPASPPLPQPSNLDPQATATMDELEEEEDIEENIVWVGCALQDIVHLTMDIEHTSGEE
ncbi:hypothetical protein BKA83DRAFT_4495781 [Pisolithus microcarpus]|nr:hypothetical protein BKA83DRAFT_4495781 [Pisolithus microcarpus]